MKPSELFIVAVACLALTGAENLTFVPDNESLKTKSLELPVGFTTHRPGGGIVVAQNTPNNAGLQAILGPSPSTIYRAGFYSAGDGGDVFYDWSSSNCSAADNGAQVQPSGTGCWIAALPPTSDVRIWGAVADGTTDGAGAINACLTARAGKGTCFAQGRYYIASGLSIPAQATLKCGDLQPMTSGAGWNTAPAILFNTSLSIAVGATGAGAGTQGCAFLPHGVTFPYANYTGFGSGVVLDDQGNADFQVTNTVVTGAAAALHVTGARPYVNRLTADGTGTTEGVVRWDVGNTDSGSMGNIELAQGYFFTGGGAGCPTGTGVYVGGSPVGAAGVFMFGKVVSEGYLTADFNFANSAIAQVLWADDFESTCGFHGSNIEVTGSGAFLTADQITAAQANIGVLLGTNTTLQAGIIFIEDTGTSGLQIGTGSGTATAEIGNLTVTGVSGGTHQIWNNTGGNMSIGNGSKSLLQISELKTDVANPFDGNTWLLGPGARTTGFIAEIPPTSVSCSGMGSSGTCTLASATNNSGIAGVINLSPNGSGIGSTGTITLTLPFGGLTTSFCQGSSSTGVGAVPVTNGVAGSMVWNSASALTGGTTYPVYYSCQYM